MLIKLTIMLEANKKEIYQKYAIGKLIFDELFVSSEHR